MYKSKIKTFDGACKFLKKDPKVLPDVSMIESVCMQKYIIAAYKLAIIAEALNLEANKAPWVPDWNNWDQYKYYPWFKIDKSGVGFAYAGYDGWGTGTNVGSRLCYISREVALYSAEQFKDIHIDFMIIK